MSASWPTSVATDSNLYVGVNELQNNLSGGINAAVTTVGINSTTGFPTVGLVLIDNEVIKYTGISGNNLTSCTRGFDGTTAASHSSSAVVSFAICADHHNVLKNEIEAIETYLSNNLGTGSQPLATGSRALASSAGGKISESSVTATELGYLSGVTSAIQTQLAAKVPTSTTVNGHALSANVTVTASDVSALPTAGGTMSGAIAMGTSKITGLGAATANGDAVRFEQVSGQRILQQVQFTTETTTNTTSSTFQVTAVTQAITPSSVSSKIRISLTTMIRNRNILNTIAYVTIKRDSTDIGGGASNGFAGVSAQATVTGDMYMPASVVYLDSPATTSSVTYAVYIRSTNNSSSVDLGLCKSVLLLEEIG